MSKLYIQGGKRLTGDVVINGAKNAAVAILPAALLVEGVSEIENLPYIDDVVKVTEAMGTLGAVVNFTNKHTVRIDATTLFNFCATEENIGKIRASYYLLGALLGRFKCAKVAMPDRKSVV